MNFILVKTGKKELSIEESCKNNVIDNNIKFTLDILFKPGNNLEINKKQYTIVNYSWLNGDWLIYSDDINTDSEEQDDSYYNYKKRIDEKSEHMITKNAFNKLNKVIPNCLKGTTIGNSLLVTGDKEILKEQQQEQDQTNEDNIDSKIKKIFGKQNAFQLSENNIYLPYNLSYNTPSFLKDPISVSLFYLEYNFKIETNNNKKLEKTFNELDEERQNLEALEQKIFKYTGSIEDRDEIQQQNLKLNEEKTNNGNNLKSLKTYNKELTNLLNEYTSKKINLCEISINSNLEQILYSINKKNYNDIPQSITQINKDIKNCRQRNYNIHHNQKTYIIKQFNKVINLINENIQELNKKQTEYSNDMTLNELENALTKETDLSKYIIYKKKYIDLCKTILENILQKIDMENDYLLSICILITIINLQLVKN